MKQNRIERENFDMCFCVIFDQYHQSFISGKETKWRALSPLIFEIFQIFSSFLNFYVLSRSASCEAICIQCFFCLEIALLVVNRTYTKIFKSFTISCPQFLTKRSSLWIVVVLWCPLSGNRHWCCDSHCGGTGGSFLNICNFCRRLVLFCEKIATPESNSWNLAKQNLQTVSFFIRNK